MFETSLESQLLLYVLELARNCGWQRFLIDDDSPIEPQKRTRVTLTSLTYAVQQTICEDDDQISFAVPSLNRISILVS